MTHISKLFFTLSTLFMLSLSQNGLAQSLQEIQEYCRSMYSDMQDDESRAYIEECINEQKAYLDQDSYVSQDQDDSQNYSDPQNEQDYATEYESYNEESYQEPAYEPESYTSESQDQDCYSKVDEQIQKLLDNDPNSPFDYDQLLEQCLKGNH